MNNQLIPHDLTQYIFDAHKDNFKNQIILRFPNNYGASIIRGFGTYGNERGLFELAVIVFQGDNWDLCYTTPITDTVLGHLNSDDVKQLCYDILALPSSNIKFVE